MSSPSLNQSAIPRRGVLALGLLTLAGCAERAILVDRAAVADVRRVALPTVGIPADPDVQVASPASSAFGAVGLITTVAVRQTRRAAMRSLVAAQGFDPHPYFQAALAERLVARGLTVLPEAADPARGAYLPAYGTADGRDATLDAYVTDWGLEALTDADMHPYRPKVTAHARLISARDRSVLMRDTIIINGITGPALAPDGRNLGPSTFAGFREINADPERAVASMRGAFAEAADAVVRRLA